jgi:hypothetical protein
MPVLNEQEVVVDQELVERVFGGLSGEPKNILYYIL